MLFQVVPDNYLYARVALIVKDKGTLSEEKLPELTEVLGEEAKGQEVRQQQQQQGGSSSSNGDVSAAGFSSGAVFGSSMRPAIGALRIAGQW